MTWEPIVAPAVTSEAIAALLSGEAPYLRLPGFFGVAWCDELARRFHAMAAERPDHRVQLDGGAYMDTLGFSIEIARSMEKYFRGVAEDAPRMRAIYQGGDDLIAKLNEQFTAIGWSVVVAAEGDQPYLTDIVLGGPGSRTPLHKDTYVVEYPDCCLSRFGYRLGANAYLHRPEAGGELVIYRRRHLSGEGQGGDGSPWIDQSFVEGVEHVAYRPEIGDMVIFDSYRYHEILLSRGSEPRLAAHTTILVDAARSEVSFVV